MEFAVIFLGFAVVISAMIFVSVRLLKIRKEFVMKVLKYGMTVVIAVLFSIISVGIGFRVDDRHADSYTRSLKSVQEIWGGEIQQNPPMFYIKTLTNIEYDNTITGKKENKDVLSDEEIGIDGQNILLNVQKSIRKKGLLLFPGYNAEFKAIYFLKNNFNTSNTFYFNFNLPEAAGNVSDISVKLNDAEYKSDVNYADGIDWSGVMNPGDSATIEISYRSQGTGLFNYALNEKRTEIKQFSFILKTDYIDITYPDGAMVPTSSESDNVVSKMSWINTNFVTGQNISVVFDVEGNYGKVVSKLFFSSPVAIFLFVSFLMLISVSKKIDLHPMHYLFILTAFFIFYLLCSYMIAYMSIYSALVISLGVSSLILLYYIYLIKHDVFLLSAAVGGVFLFQWIFSIAFFFPEHTGFIITICGIAGFLALIKITAKIDWTDKW